MNALLFVVQATTALIVLYFVLLLLVGVAGIVLAHYGLYFTSIEKGKTLFISRGKDLKAVLPNVGGHRMSQEQDFNGWRWLVKDDSKGSWYRWFRSFFYSALFGTKLFRYFLWRLFAVIFISPIWPWVQVFLFKVSRMHLKEGADVDPEKPLKERVVPSLKREEPVDSLLFLAPRPIYMDGLQLAGDNARINFLFLAIFQQVVPALPVYYLEGDFYPLLDAAVEAAMVDFCAVHRVAVDENGDFVEDSYDLNSSKAPKVPTRKRKGEEDEDFRKRKEEISRTYRPAPLTYSYWLKMGKGAGSPIEKHLRKISVSRAYCNRLDGKDADGTDITGATKKGELLEHLKQLDMVPTEEVSPKLVERIGEGIIPRIGFALVSLRLVDWEPNGVGEGTTADLATAYRQREIMRRRADGVREEALGVRDAIEARAKGESMRYQQLVAALVEKGVNPNVAAEVLRTDLRTANIRDSNVRTYVEGGASASVMVTAEEGEPTAPSPPPPTPPSPHSP